MQLHKHAIVLPERPLCTAPGLQESTSAASTCNREREDAVSNGSNASSNNASRAYHVPGPLLF
jgi:hypothetical protein